MDKDLIDDSKETEVLINVKPQSSNVCEDKPNIKVKCEPILSENLSEINVNMKTEQNSTSLLNIKPEKNKLGVGKDVCLVDKRSSEEDHQQRVIAINNDKLNPADKPNDISNEELNSCSNKVVGNMENSGSNSYEDEKVDNSRLSEADSSERPLADEEELARNNVVEIESSSTTSPQVEIYLPLTAVDVNKVKIKIEDERDSGEVKGTYTSFTRCQPDSGTDDSESDSSDSSSSSHVVSLSEDERATKSPRPRKQEPEKTKKKINHLYKGEMDIDDLPPIEDLHITVPEEECEPLGTICSIVNQLVVVESMENKPALNLDSLLFKKSGECIGQIFDVFGPVKIPYYTLRFNNKEEILNKGIEIGQVVYCAPQTKHTKYVFVYQLMKQKGSDASWKHNYEVPDAMVDYSDDEEEKKAKRKHHQKTRERPYCQNKDHGSAQKIKNTVKTELNHDYNHCSGNEWYKTRASEMNQFNRSNRNQHRNQINQHQRNFLPNQGANQPSFSLPSQSTPPSLLRPPTPNNWSSTPPNVQYPPPIYPPNHNGPPQPQFFPNPFALQQTFNQHIPYEKLNSAAQFTNPIMQYPGLLSNPPPPPIYPQISHNIKRSNIQNNLSNNAAPSIIPNVFNNCLRPPRPTVNQDPNFYNHPPNY